MSMRMSPPLIEQTSSDLTQVSSYLSVCRSICVSLPFIEQTVSDSTQVSRKKIKDYLWGYGRIPPCTPSPSIILEKLWPPYFDHGLYIKNWRPTQFTTRTSSNQFFVEAFISLRNKTHKTVLEKIAFYSIY